MLMITKKLLSLKEEQMKKLAILIACLSFLIAGPALSKDISFDAGLTQSAFADLSKEAGSALSYKNLSPAEPLGVIGFDVGLEGSFVSISTGKNNYWEKAFSNDAPSMLVLPKLRVQKGLPFGIDVGAMYSYLPGSNIKLFGAEVSYAILEGSIATPALKVRGTYTKLTGVSDLAFQTTGIDASISKGFLLLTPYAGVGLVRIDSKAQGDLQTLSALLPGGPLNEEKIWQSRYFVGLKISPLPLFAVTAEAEYSKRPVYSLKAAISF
jgi:hypothetical protein